MEMACSNRFVVCIIQNDQILKELDNGSVPIPFGAEYKIRLRNKHNRRAVCKLYIDNENVSDGGFIIGANKHIDIERPVDIARKFKFVSLDSEEAYDHGKNGPNLDKSKGVIRAEFALEKEEYKYPYHTCYDDNFNYKEPYKFKRRITYGDCSKSIGAAASLFSGSLGSLGSESYTSSSLRSCNLNHLSLQDGATVEGSHSKQSFNTIYFNNEDNWTTVKLFLQGFNLEDIKQVEYVKIETKPDKELNYLENELLELKKQKLKQEIEKLKSELTI